MLLSVAVLVRISAAAWYRSSARAVCPSMLLQLGCTGLDMCCSPTWLGGLRVLSRSCPQRSCHCPACCRLDWHACAPALAGRAATVVWDSYPRANQQCHICWATAAMVPSRYGPAVASPEGTALWCPHVQLLWLLACAHLHVPWQLPRQWCAYNSRAPCRQSVCRTRGGGGMRPLQWGVLQGVAALCLVAGDLFGPGVRGDLQHPRGYMER